MRLRAGSWGWLGWSLAATLAAALAAPAAAMSSGSGALSPRLAVLAKPSVRSKSPARQAAILSVAPSGPGSLLREGSRVLVDVRFDHGAAGSLDALRAASARIVTVSRRYQTVTVAATPASLRAVAAVPRVQGVTEDLAPIAYSAGGSPFTSATGMECEGGSVVSEGVEQLHVKEARDKFSVNGSGVTVGVLSDSFNTATHAADEEEERIATHAAEDVERGDLPGSANPCSGQKTPVRVLEDYSPKSNSEEPEAADEGRAMLQIVHDVAPDASLAFATAFKGEPAFAQNIEKLAKPVSEGGAGAKVIADDAAYFDEPFFQDGPVAAAVNEVTTEGVSYFSAAGNNNLFDAGGHEISSWEAPRFRDSGACPLALEAIPGIGANHCMNFNPGAGTDDTFGITVDQGATLTVDLQWAEPWFGVRTDLDVFLLDSEGKPIEEEGELVGSAGDNVTSQKPVEVFQWENAGPTQEVQLAINHCSSACNPAASSTSTPRLKFAMLENGGGVSATEYPTSVGGDEVGPTIFGHSGAASAISVGAVPYFDSSEPEEYSSRGPVTHYFGPVTGTSPASTLPSPQTISKPDVAATDCVVTTFFAQLVGSTWRFCGTSASAPHAAGVAALMAEAEPSATPEQIRSALLGSAVPVGTLGPCAVGSGLVDAVGAVEQVLSPAPGSAPPVCDPPVSAPLSEPAPATSQVQTQSAPKQDKRPRVFFVSHPPKAIRTHHKKVDVAFRFGSNKRGATFVCEVDRGLYHLCPPMFSRWFALGKHAVRVKARDTASGVDSTPAVFHFSVERVG